MTKKPLAGLILALLMALSLMLLACGDATNTSAPAGGATTGTSTTAAMTTAAGTTTAAMTSAAATTAAMTSASATTAAMTTTSATTAAMTSAAATTTAAATTAAGGTATTAAATGATDCSANSGPKGKVVVASKNFPESVIIGNMYADILEANGIPVERKMNLGTVAIVQAAMCKGDVSLYPEYTGTGLGAVLKQTATTNDPQAVYKQVADAYEKQFKFTWLDVAPYNNSNGIAVTADVSKQYNLTKLSQLPAVASNLRFATNPEFVGDRSAIDGLDSIKKTYGDFNFKSTQQVDINLRYQALLNKQAEACVAFGTDGEIAGYKLVLLEDDKHNFPPYQTGPVIRDDILAANPKIKDLLNQVSAKLTNQKVSDLNWKVSGPDKQDAEDVAKDFLKSEGLLK